MDKAANIIDIPISEGESEEKSESQSKSESRAEEIRSQIEAAEKELEELSSLENKLMTEDLVVQEDEWLRSMAEEKRIEEVRLREELFEKQKLLEKRRKELSESMDQTRQMQLYNRMHDEEQRDQVYELHGISMDKVQGMKEYKNALYQGAQIILFFVDIVIGVVSAMNYGYESPIFISCIALMAAQTTLLPREHHGLLNKSLYSVISIVLSFIPTALMGILFVSDKIPFVSDLPVVFICACVSVVLCAVGALDYYNRNPYRESRKAAREAASEYRALKRGAAKTVKKNVSIRMKREAKLMAHKEKQENKLERIKKREEERYENLKKREENKAKALEIKLQKEEERKAKNEQIREIREANREQRKKLIDSKVAVFKEKITSIIPDKKASGDE